MANVTFHPSALREYRQGVAWYQERSEAAARSFAAEVEQLMVEIGRQPERFGWYEVPFREAGLLRHPYSVIYRIEESGDLLVMAVAHTSREPGYWINRG